MLCIKHLILLCLGMLMVASAYEQNSSIAENGKISPVRVTNEQKNNFPFAWAGGMNSCQFNEVDMNLDGMNDLLVFDRVGDRLMPFINGGQPQSIDYSYAPQYIGLFPQLYSWAIFRDYDGDGRMDIFTYARDYPGLIVYRNISQNELKFELVVSPYLTSFQGGGEVNLLVTEADYPAIEDIDGDGDLDILTFWGLGSFVEYHQNQSMELYGTPDSLKYVKVSQCWGHFAENEEGNQVYLDTCQNGGDHKGSVVENGVRHTGSTFLLIDLDNDQDKDLLLGDVDYPNLVALINEPQDGADHIIEQYTDFPQGDTAINLFSMPCVAYLDVNNDGAKDLLVSPFDPSLITSENHESSWLYLNTGSTAAPEFHLKTKSFLQDQMIDVGSGAVPVLADYNGDGLLDLFISNYGYYMYSTYSPGMLLNSVYWSNIALFENTGTALAPRFSAVTHDFASLHHHHLTALYPTFGDVDGDGDQDMVCGQKNGSLMFLENTSGIGNPMEFTEPLMDYFNIDVGAFSSPVLFDADKDGLLDLIVGEEEGNLNYFHNAGTATNPDFIFTSDFLGEVNVADPNLSYYGYSTPQFFTDFEGNSRLLVGSEQGKLFYFNDIDGNLSGAFTSSDSLFTLIGIAPLELMKGIRIAPCICDLNADNFMELIVGNYSGGLHYYQAADSPPVSDVSESSALTMTIFPNPVSQKLHIHIPGNLHGKCMVEIYASTGELLLKKSFPIKKDIVVDVSLLMKGIYLCRIKSEELSTTSFILKFVK